MSGACCLDGLCDGGAGIVAFFLSLGGDGRGDRAEGCGRGDIRCRWFRRRGVDGVYVVVMCLLAIKRDSCARVKGPQVYYF